MGYCASTLNRAKADGPALVEVGRTAVKPDGRSTPIELVVERRYLLRLWPGMEPDLLQDVLSVLEPHP